MSLDSFIIPAPAKVNLYLHVTGRQPDGYHELDSLVVFADIADEIRIDRDLEFSFLVEGPHAGEFHVSERSSGLSGSNLVVRAARTCADYCGRPLRERLTLTKSIPLASGIGGGSADAAATVRGLFSFWNISPPPLEALMPFLLSLGSDVPSCYLSQALHMRGTGDRVRVVDFPYEFPAVLVNPRIPCPTPEVFRLFHERKMPYARAVNLPETSTREEWLLFLRQQDNSLESSSRALCPAIGDVLDVLQGLPDCRLARMCGSGATCAGLFDSAGDAQKAAAELAMRKPDWWVKSCTLNRPYC